jgi:hypothetical protein
MTGDRTRPALVGSRSGATPRARLGLAPPDTRHGADRGDPEVDERGDGGASARAIRFSVFT